MKSKKKGKTEPDQGYSGEESKSPKGGKGTEQGIWGRKQKADWKRKGASKMVDHQEGER